MDVDLYALGKMASEMGEAQQIIGNCICFGLDTPQNNHESGRQALARELGDVLAAITWAIEAGVVDENAVALQAHHKLEKLLDPTQRTNDGRQLAPSLVKDAA